MWKGNLLVISICVEVVGIAVIGIGVGIEIACHADVGYLTISGGSLALATGGLLWAKLVRR